MKGIKVAFVGFGEVASILSEAVSLHGADVSAYDILMEAPGGRELLRKRKRAEAISFLSLEDALAGADYVLSTVTTDKAEEVARACAPHLQRGIIYVDMNATAPSVKRTIAEIISPTGADFVEGAILGAVGVTGAKTRILTGGPSSGKAASALAALGLNVVSYSTEIGRASAFKMLRSVFSKGMEALLLEFLISGKRAGLQQELWEEITNLFSTNPFDKVASNWIRTHVRAHRRRCHEIRQVRELLQEMGIDPVVTAATEAFFERSCRLGLHEAFREIPDKIDPVIEYMEEKQSGTGSASPCAS